MSNETKAQIDIHLERVLVEYFFKVGVKWSSKGGGSIKLDPEILEQTKKSIVKIFDGDFGDDKFNG